MLNYGKFPVLGVNVHAVDYEYAVSAIVEAAKTLRPFTVSALAVHGVMTGAMDAVHMRRLNGLDLVVPDGQPVRFALWFVHGRRLPDRVYGPELTLRTMAACAREKLPVFLYGSTADVVARFQANMQRRFPDLQVAGCEPSRFRRISHEEAEQIAATIQGSGARVVFVGLGCPRQEVWAFELREMLQMPILAVGAAFDFHAGTLRQAPPWMQRCSLEWFYRLCNEPTRLWQRYIVLNPLYCWKLAGQKVTGRHAQAPMPSGAEPWMGFA
jgi:N-acetylglucosaminyldiphosphoundecaprenol N-acetyl-beta-D-mannosaminyltransferase